MKLWRLGEAIALIISTISFCAAIFLSYYFVNTRPAVPEPLSNRIYAHDVHGHVAYVSKEEKIGLVVLFWIAGIGFVLGVCIEQYKHHFK